MTPERAARHKRQDANRLCKCGMHAETIAHVSWYCQQYSNEREEVYQLLQGAVEELPICFTYAGIVPHNFRLDDDQIRLVQAFLVAIWQKHIVQWRSGGDLVDRHEPSVSTNTVVQDVEENGHLLAARTNGPGIWCRRCGKYVQRLQHIRLKITGQPCDHPNGPLLHNEGYSRSSSRLDTLERELNVKYNRGKHLLLWNRKVGKIIGFSDEGFIKCLKCKRQWRWKDRIGNLSRTTCILSQSVNFTKRIRTKSTPSHVQDTLTVSPLR